MGYLYKDIEHIPIVGKDNKSFRPKDLYIVMLDGLHGIMKYSINEEFIIPLEYEDIYQHGNYFVLVKDGKWGLCKIKTDGDVIQTEYFVEMIAKCEYDNIRDIKKFMK